VGAEFREKLALIPEKTRACIDESGINKPLVREYGRAPRGVKIGDVKSGRKFQRTNVVAAMTGGGIVARSAISGTRQAPPSWSGSGRSLSKRYPKARPS
jgi:hypothetical protein